MKIYVGSKEITLLCQTKLSVHFWHVCLCHNLQSHSSVNHLVFPMPTTLLISSFCLGHDRYCVGSCIGHLRWCAGISGVLSGHIAIQPSHLWHKWRLALPTAGKNIDRMDGKTTTKSSWGHFKDCVYVVVCGEHLCQTIRGSSKERPLLYCMQCKKRWWHRPGRAPLSAATQAYLRSDSSTNTPPSSSSSWLALKPLPVLPVRLHSPSGSYKIPALVSLCLSEWPWTGLYIRSTWKLVDDLAQIQFPICLVPMYYLK